MNLGQTVPCNSVKGSAVLREGLNEIKNMVESITSKLADVENTIIIPRPEPNEIKGCVAVSSETLAQELQGIWQRLDWINTRIVKVRDTLQEQLGDNLPLI